MALSRTLRWELDHSASSETNDKQYTLNRVDNVFIDLLDIMICYILLYDYMVPVYSVSFDVVDEVSL